MVYRLAVTIDDGVILFCQRFFDKFIDKRTIEQMVQASRSGKQNIVEGSLEKSVEGNIKLTGVARASYGELQNLKLWEKNDSRVWRIRSFRESTSVPTKRKLRT